MGRRCLGCKARPHPGARFCQGCGAACAPVALAPRRLPLLRVGLGAFACVCWLTIGLSLAGTRFMAVTAAAERAGARAAATPAPATRPAGGAVAGKVSAEGGKALPEMVIYLESADGRAFEPPREVVRVSQKDAKFTPSLVVVAAGQSVDFRNDEARPIEHNVFSRSPAKPFDLGLYRPGAPDKLVTFDKPGPVRLACSIHRYMDGVVYVCPTPLFSRVDAKDGGYKIENVPPGNYKLKTWQRSLRFQEQESPVKVAGGATSTVNVQMARK